MAPGDPHRRAPRDPRTGPLARTRAGPAELRIRQGTNLRGTSAGTAPGDPLPDEVEVEIRAAEPDREHARPGTDPPGTALLGRTGGADGALDLTRIAADVGAVPLQHGGPVPERPH